MTTEQKLAIQKWLVGGSRPEHGEMYSFQYQSSSGFDRNNEPSACISWEPYLVFRQLSDGRLENMGYSAMAFGGKTEWDWNPKTFQTLRERVEDVGTRSREGGFRTITEAEGCDWEWQKRQLEIAAAMIAGKK